THSGQIGVLLQGTQDRDQRCSLPERCRLLPFHPGSKLGVQPGQRLSPQSKAVHVPQPGNVLALAAASLGSGAGGVVAEALALVGSQTRLVGQRPGVQPGCGGMELFPCAELSEFNGSAGPSGWRVPARTAGSLPSTAARRAASRTQSAEGCTQPGRFEPSS